MKYVYKDNGNGYNAIASFESYSEILDHEFVTRLGDNVNLHYSCHHVDEENPDKRKFKYGDLIFFDIDNYQNFEAAIDAVSEILQVSRNQFTCVNSGNGLHLILEVNKYSEEFILALKPAYKLAVKLLNEKLGITTVDNVFNISKTLRLPNTINRKEKDDKLCTIIQKGIKSSFNFVTWYTNKLNPTAEIQKAQSPEPFSIVKQETLDTSAEFTPVPLNLIPHKTEVKPIIEEEVPEALTRTLEQCEFIKASHSTPEIYSREEWMLACLILFHHGEQGLAQAHKISEKDARYKPREIDQMFQDAANRGIKPPNCNTVHEMTSRHGNSKCITCPARKTSNCPAMIAPIGITTFKNGFYMIEETAKGPKNHGPHYKELVRYAHDKHNIIYVSEHSEFYIFNKSHYEKISEERIGKLLQDYLNPRPTSTIEARRAIDNAKIELCKDSIKDSLPAHLIPLKNGLLNINSLVIEKHNPKYFYTSIMPVIYDPRATAPTFDSWLRDRAPDNESAEAILDYLTYTLCGVGYSNRSMLVLQSTEGGTGKSMLLEILLNFFGDQCVMINQHTLESRFGMSSFYGKRCAVMDELSPSRADFLIEKLKSITATNFIEVEEKGKKAFTAENYCRIVLACNELPQQQNKSAAFDERLLLVPFTKKIHKYDQSYRINIFQESSGILNLLLARANKMKNQNFFITKPAATVEAVREYSESDDHLLDFINDNYEYCEPTREEFHKHAMKLTIARYGVSETMKQMKKEPSVIHCQQLFEHYLEQCQKDHVKYIYSKIMFHKNIKRLFTDSRRKIGFVEMNQNNKTERYLICIKKRD